MKRDTSAVRPAPEEVVPALTSLDHALITALTNAIVRELKNDQRKSPETPTTNDEIAD